MYKLAPFSWPFNNLIYIVKSSIVHDIFVKLTLCLYKTWDSWAHSFVSEPWWITSFCLVFISQYFLPILFFKNLWIFFLSFFKRFIVFLFLHCVQSIFGELFLGEQQIPGFGNWLQWQLFQTNFHYFIILLVTLLPWSLNRCINSLVSALKWLFTCCVIVSCTCPSFCF